jgi:hypothetical protein
MNGLSQDFMLHLREALTASWCGFNRSTQHYKLLWQEECCDEKQTSDLLH